MTRQCRIVKIREESERHSTSNIPFQMANPSHFNVNSTEMDTHVPSGQSSSIPANNTATESYFPSVGTNTAKSTATESYFPSVGTNTANPLYVGVELLGALSNSQCILGNCTDNDIRNRGDVANQFDACNPNNTDHHNSGEDGEDSEDELSLNVPYKTNYCDSEEDDDDASINDVASNISNISNGNSWSDQNINVHSVERLEENANDDDSNPSNDPDACLEYPLYNTDELALMRNEITEHRRGLCMEKEIMSSLELSALLEKANAPLYLTKDIIAWATRNREHLPTYNEPISRQTLLATVSDKLYSERQQTVMKPLLTNLNMPSGRTTSVTTFDIIGCLCQLLSDAKLMNWSNLIFDGHEQNPFDLPGMTDPDTPYGEIESGDWYKNAYSELITDKETQILVPLVFFIDGTKISEYGTLSMEPVSMIPMIFNLETRNKAEAARVIGYIPNFDNMPGSKLFSPDEKAKDYHHVLGHIMKGVRGLQNCEGLDWTFISREGATHVRRLVFTTQYIIGDCKGNDILCGRYGTHANTGGLVRDCDIRTEDGDSTLHRCKFRQVEEVKTFSAEQLKGASLRRIPNNAFDKIIFGASIHGIYGSTPPEPLHVYKLGICARLPTTFFERISITVRKQLDITVAFISTNFGRQSDRNFPSLQPFRDGLSSTPKLTADERYARCFAIYLALSTTEFSKHMIGSDVKRVKNKLEPTPKLNKRETISKEEYQRWLKVFEETLTFYQWIMLKKHPKKYFEGGWDSAAACRCRKFMDMYKDVAKRNTGMGLKLTKFHQLGHWWFYITQFGCVPNFDGGCHESNAKVNTKNCARVTQLRASSLNYQTGVRHYEKYILKEASLLHDIDITVEGPRGTCEDEEDWVVTGSKFLLTFIYKGEEGFVPPDPECQCIANIEWVSHRQSQPDTFLDPLVFSCIKTKLEYYNGGIQGRRLKSIVLFTEFRSGDALCRAHPSYRSGLPWHDWVWIEWPDYEFLLVAKVLLMLDFRTCIYQSSPNHVGEGLLGLDFTNTAKLEDDSGLCAVVHSAANAKDITPNHLRSKLSSRMSMENEFQLVSLRSFRTSAYVIVDDLNEFTNLPTVVISFINLDFWSDCFLNYTEE
jgi:hypothetical protein